MSGTPRDALGRYHAPDHPHAAAAQLNISPVEVPGIRPKPQQHQNTHFIDSFRSISAHWIGLGGFYATVYTARNADLVKGAILIDANEICFFTDEHVKKMRNSATELEALKRRSPGRYYLALEFENIVSLMRRTPFPANIPVLDIVAEQTLFEGTPDAERWRACHRDFVAASPQRSGLTAYGSGHYIFNSNPELVVAAIVASYARVAAPPRRLEVLNRAADSAIDTANQARRREVSYRHSEGDLNSWAYALMQQNKTDQALQVFKLNASLYPDSWNVHDSLAEGYEAVGDHEQARRHYKRAVELNPEAQHARKLSRPLNLHKRGLVVASHRVSWKMLTELSRSPA